jgi:hypothetical protein
MHQCEILKSVLITWRAEKRKIGKKKRADEQNNAGLGSNNVN